VFTGALPSAFIIPFITSNWWLFLFSNGQRCRSWRRSNSSIIMFHESLGSLFENARHAPRNEHLAASISSNRHRRAIARLDHRSNIYSRHRGECPSFLRISLRRAENRSMSRREFNSRGGSCVLASRSLAKNPSRAGERPTRSISSDVAWIGPGKTAARSIGPRPRFITPIVRSRHSLASLEFQQGDANRPAGGGIPAADSRCRRVRARGRT